MSDTLASALAQVQAELPKVAKGRQASIRSDKGAYAYSYADLSDVSTALLPLLARHGLAWSCLPRATDRGYELAGVLLHVSGERLEGSLPITGGTPQQLGSSLTYMRRYLLGCMTGLVTDDDDDARAATEAAHAHAREVRRQQAEDAAPRISEPQSRRLHALLGEVGLKDRDKYLAVAKWSAGRDVSSTSELTQAEASALIDYLATRAADMHKSADEDGDES